MAEKTLLGKSIDVEKALNKYDSYCAMKWVGRGEFGIVFKVGGKPTIHISLVKGTYKFEILKGHQKTEFNTFDELLDYLAGKEFKILMEDLKKGNQLPIGSNLCSKELS